MLQINTGKLYEHGVGRTNHLTGVLYSNARLPSERPIVTAAGTLKSTGFGTADMALVYELEERIEAQKDGPGVLVSHTVAPFLDDFASVASFGLEAIVSRDADSARYLTGGRPGYSSLARRANSSHASSSGLSTSPTRRRPSSKASSKSCSGWSAGPTSRR